MLVNNVVLSNNGQVFVTAPALITVFCELDAANYPFDEKHCEFKWASWMYFSDLMQIQAGPSVILNSFIGKYISDFNLT